MPTKLFDREIVLTLGGLRIASRDQTTGEGKPILRVQFRVERTLQKEPNTAEISIFNLSKASRTAIQEKGIPVEIEAGYFGTTSLIFKGDLDFGETQRAGTDWITTLQTTDGGKSYRSSRTNLSFDAGTLISDVAKRLGEELGVGLGNLTDEFAKGLPRQSAKEYLGGLVTSGQASLAFDKIIKRAGFEWSIQDGQIQLTRPGKVLDPNEAIVLSQGTGLIGSPEAGEKGTINARSLLQPELTPGKRVQIITGPRDAAGVADLDAFFRIEKGIFTGDTWGNDWFSDIEASPVT